jgi:hypothetical protein
MVEKKLIETRQAGLADAATQPVVDLLASILNEVQNRVQVNAAATPQSLVGEALRAVNLFKEIEAAITLTARPTVTLKADPASLPDGGGAVRLTWTSAGAQTVSIVGVDANGATVPVGDVSPAPGGSVNVNITTTSRFTATATGRCRTTASVEVLVGSIIF